jgi:hypothetical protein
MSTTGATGKRRRWTLQFADAMLTLPYCRPYRHQRSTSALARNYLDPRIRVLLLICFWRRHDHSYAHLQRYSS